MLIFKKAYLQRKNFTDNAKEKLFRRGIMG
jgi:hypothetical protein